MLALISVAAIIASFIIIFLEIRFYKKQKEECKKYPFYHLRDQIVLSIAQSDEPEKYEKIYESTNETIRHLKQLKFGFRFYSEVLTQVFHDSIEKAYKNDWRIDEDLIKEMKEGRQLPPFAYDFTDLILETAKSNSLLLRCAMTNVGYKVLCATQIIRATSRFLTGHPELYRKTEMLQGYSYLNQLQYAAV